MFVVGVCFVYAGVAAVDVVDIVVAGASKQSKQHNQNNNNNKQTRDEQKHETDHACWYCVSVCLLLSGCVFVCFIVYVFFVLRVVVAVVVGANKKRPNAKTNTHSQHDTCGVVD